MGSARDFTVPISGITLNQIRLVVRLVSQSKHIPIQFPILVHCGGKGKALTFVPSPSP